MSAADRFPAGETDACAQARARETRKDGVMKSLLLGGTILALSGCAVAHRAVDVVEPQPEPVRPAVVTILNGDTSVIDVEPPQRLDVRYYGSDGIEQDYFQEDCDHSGGRLEWSTEWESSGEFICRGVDY